MVQKLIPEIGFPWAMRSAAFLILGMLAIANLTIKSRIPPNPRPFKFMDFIRPLSELPFVLIVAASFLFFLGIFLPFNFIILQAGQVGMSANLASYLLAILNAASIFGRTIPGFLADRFGRFNVMIFMSYFSGIVVLALWLPAKANAPVIVFAALYGFGSGAFVSMAPALIAQISDIRQIGTRTGTMFSIISVAALVGNPIGGALLSNEDGKFQNLQIFCGVFLLAGSTVFVAARWSLVGFKLKIKI